MRRTFEDPLCEQELPCGMSCLHASVLRLLHNSIYASSADGHATVASPYACSLDHPELMALWLRKHHAQQALT